MTNNVTKFPGGQPQAVEPLRPMLSEPRFLRFCTNGLMQEADALTIYSDRAPTDEQRSILLRRITALQAKLEERDDDRLMNVLTITLSSMPSASQHAEDAANRARGYRLALGDLPIWSVREACKRVLAGDYEEHRKFCPTPPELATLARALVAPLLAELRKIELVLDARVIDPPPMRKPKAAALTWGQVAAEKDGEPKAPEVSGWATADILADLQARKARRETEGGAA